MRTRFDATRSRGNPEEAEEAFKEEIRIVATKSEAEQPEMEITN